WYYQLSGNRTYRDRAISIDDWLFLNLQRRGQKLNGQTYPNDGVYFVGMNKDGSVEGAQFPSLVAQTCSTVMLVGDMSTASLGARLYADTHNDLYLARLRKTAEGIRAIHSWPGVAGTVCSNNSSGHTLGALFSARDARVDGWASVFYARHVVP